MLRGACHCGAVRFEVSRAPDQVTSCNCSNCTKRGGLWAYYSPEEFTLISDEGQSTYLWNDRVVQILEIIHPAFGAEFFPGVIEV